MLEFSRRIQFSGIEYSSRDVLFVLIDHVLGGLLMGLLALRLYLGLGGG